MTDLLIKLHRNPASSRLVKALGLPEPVELRRASGGYEERPFADKTVLLARTHAGYAAEFLAQAIVRGGGVALSALPDKADVNILVCDASGCRSPSDFHALYKHFHHLMRRFARNARVLIVAAAADSVTDPVAAGVARGIEGFCRSLAKEVGKRGTTVNLITAAPDAIDRLEGPLRFFCGPQSTYVSGQAVHLHARVAAPSAIAYSKALQGKVALVTGSARGIGAATAERLVQEGAQVVCLDVPTSADDLHATCSRIGAIPLLLDIAAADAPRSLADFIAQKFGGLDILVHNAGITRDRTLANMKPHYWDIVVDINFTAVLAIDALLLSENVLRDEARIVCLSSISGVAGNVGQTNYATSKAALIGYVAAQAPRLAARGIAINAIAPGFIETSMTAAMPWMTREIGRRLNSLAQGGQPRDAAELITFLCTPGAVGISGATIRVCGQGWIGA